MNTASVAMRQETDTARKPTSTGADAETAANGASAAPAAVSESDGTNQPPTRRDAMRLAYERGDSVGAIASLFSVSTAYVFKVRKAGDWQRNAPPAQAGLQQSLDQTAPTNGRHPGAETNLPTVQTNLDSTSAAVAQTVAGLIVQGLPTIAPPRNLRELAGAFDVYRRAAGLDKPNASGARVLINLGAGIRVRERAAAQVVDAAADGDE